MSTLPDTRDDAALLAAAADGDRDAFASFYRRHLPAVARVLLAETRDRELAADLAADVFAVALQSAGRYRPEHEDALPWLRGIARNKAAEARRQGRSRERLRRRLMGAHDEAVSEDDLERVEELAAHDGRLLALLERLPAAQREALHARVIDERDYAEIADAQGSSEQAVRQRVSRGLAWLRAHATVAGATFLATALAAAAALILWAGDDPPAPAAPPRSLPAAMAVLRRAQQPGDAPAAVVEKARVAAGRAEAPFRGTIDPGRVRLVAELRSERLRLYLAPITRPDGVDDSAVTLRTDLRGRVLGGTTGLTLDALTSGRYFMVLNGVPGPQNLPGRLTSRVLVLVADGVATVDVIHSDGQMGFLGTVRRQSLSAGGNVAVRMLDGASLPATVLRIVTRDAQGRERSDVSADVSGRGPLTPQEACAGTTPRQGPTRVPRIGMSRDEMTLRVLCEQAGVPLDAYRRATGRLLLLYPEGTLVGTDDGRIGLITHIDPADFPPAIADALPAPPRLRTPAG